MEPYTSSSGTVRKSASKQHKESRLHASVRYRRVQAVLLYLVEKMRYNTYNITVYRNLTYDELYDQNVHRVFNFWTEYHARVMGTQYMMKCRRENNSPYAEHDNVVGEFKVLAEWYNNRSGPGDRMLEYDATLLGMLRVFEMYFPETFNDECLSDSESMQKLYRFLKDHNAIEEGAPCFQMLHDLMKGVHPSMP